MLPPFNEAGDLPPGVHEASLSEVVIRFGPGMPQRKSVTLRLMRIFELAMQTGRVHSFLIFGSYVSCKDAPNDVDVFLVMKNSFDVGQVTGEARLIFDHAAADAHFGASVFWVREVAALGGVQAALEDWQIKRDGTLRGIVMVRHEEF